MDIQSFAREIRDRVRADGVVDAHHHMLSPAQRQARGTGLTEFLRESYLAADLTAAGLSWQALADTDDTAAWEHLRAVLPATRFTSSHRIIQLALRDLLDVQKPFWEADWRDLDARIRAASADPDWSATVLQRHCGLTHGILDKQAIGTTNIFLTQKAPDWYDFIRRDRPLIDHDTIAAATKRRDVIPPLSCAAVKIDAFLWGYVPAAAAELELLYHVPATPWSSLEEYLEYVDRCCEQMREEGAVALKSAFAGVRRLDYRVVTTDEIADTFGKPVGAWTAADVVDFEDYMIGYLADRAAVHGLPFQFHTGTPFSGPVADHDLCCALMTELIQHHPDTRFVLMHGSFPYTRELANLAKRFANVYVDTSWLPILSQAAAEQAFREFLDLVPHGKLVWGGDAVFAEETYGALLVACEALAGALETCITAGRLSREDALDLACCVLGRNARKIFSLS